MEMLSAVCVGDYARAEQVATWLLWVTKWSFQSILMVVGVSTKSYRDLKKKPKLLPKRVKL